LTHLYQRCILVGSTRKQLRNSSRIFAIVLLYCTCGRHVPLGFQGIVPSTPTLLFCSTRNKRRNSSPIFAIVLLYCICQRAVFISCPVTLACGRLVALRMQGIVPSTQTLLFFRPGTSAAIPAQSPPSYFCTASASVRSSSVVHLPLRAVVSSLLETKISRHLVRHWLFVRP
jgi:hypothetical protein